ncbi:MAG: Nucleoside-diphosphate-sugar epimerase [Phenylobacterium sp.]|jgi:CDP-paratose 2-epimerase|nr:Nucleoside-diphosphate-sugar epimerase [Phenylobacterium sp.]
MRALVTGGAGFIGCNLADRLAAEGAEVVVYDALTRPGVEANLAWLRVQHGEKIRPVLADIRDEKLLARAARDVDVIFHLAAQVAVTTSLVDPREDFAVNALGTLNVLEAARRRRTPVIFASTN